jgi:hypothetical protein
MTVEGLILTMVIQKFTSTIIVLAITRNNNNVVKYFFHVQLLCGKTNLKLKKVL